MQEVCRQTHLAEVTGVVLVHQDAVVVLATGVTAPTCSVPIEIKAGVSVSHQT